MLGAFNQEKALVGAFPMIVKTDGTFAALILLLCWNLLWQVTPHNVAPHWHTWSRGGARSSAGNKYSESGFGNKICTFWHESVYISSNKCFFYTIVGVFEMSYEHLKFRLTATPDGKSWLSLLLPTFIFQRTVSQPQIKFIKKETWPWTVTLRRF